MFYVFQIIRKNHLKLSSFRQKSNEFCIHKPKSHISSTLESEMYLGQGMNETEDTAFFFQIQYRLLNVVLKFLNYLYNLALNMKLYNWYCPTT